MTLFLILCGVALLGITVGVWLDWHKPPAKPHHVILVRHGNLIETEESL